MLICAKCGGTEMREETADEIADRLNRTSPEVAGAHRNGTVIATYMDSETFELRRTVIQAK